MNQQTQKNPVTGVQGKAFDYINTLLFAEYSRKNGNPELADLLERTAFIQRFGCLTDGTEVTGRVEGDAQNPGYATVVESKEIDDAYLKLANLANVERNQDEEMRFAEAEGDEIGLRDLLKATPIKFNQSLQR